MLHIAIKIPEGWGYEDMAKALNGTDIPKYDRTFIADTSLSALKERVRDAVRREPESRYLLLSGGTIAEMTAPPISFRQW